MSKHKHRYDGMTKKLKALIILLCLVCGISVVGIYLLLGGRIVSIDAPGISKDELHKAVIDAINAYAYSEVLIEKVTMQDDANDKLMSYLYTADKNMTEHSLVMQDDNNVLMQYWTYNKSMDTSDVYIYKTDVSTYVNISIDGEPYRSNLWDFDSRFEEYTLHTEIVEWENTGDECYILYFLGKSEEWDGIYEELYIRTSDFIPMGIISYAYKTEDGSTPVVTIDEPRLFGATEITSEDIHISSQDSVFIRMEFNYSKEAFHVVDKPDEYITAEEYSEIISLED